MWTLYNAAADITASFHVEAGDITEIISKDTEVVYPLRGTTPYVGSSAAREAYLDFKSLVCIVYSSTELANFKALHDLGNKCVLTDDETNEWTVKFVGDLKVVRRASAEVGSYRRYVECELVGVEA